MILAAGKMEELDDDLTISSKTLPAQPESPQKPLREKITDFLRSGMKHSRSPAEHTVVNENVLLLRQHADQAFILVSCFGNTMQQTINNVSHLLNALDNLKPPLPPHQENEKEPLRHAEERPIEKQEQLVVVDVSRPERKAKESQHGSEALVMAAQQCHQLANTVEREVPEADEEGGQPQIAGYLAPERMVQALLGPVKSSLDKAEALAKRSQSASQEDAFDLAALSRKACSTLVPNANKFLQHEEAAPETRLLCSQYVHDLCTSYFKLLRDNKLALDSPDRFDVAQLRQDSASIAHISSQLLDLLHKHREGPRLVMYFRASSPQWRDITEKYIGRHVAYHYHQLTGNNCSGANYSCVHVPYSTGQSALVLGSSASEEANSQLEIMLRDLVTRRNCAQNSLSTVKSRLDRAVLLLASVREIVESCQVLVKGSSKLVDQASFQGLSPEQNNQQLDALCFGRSELGVALACRDLCNVAHTFTDSCGSREKNLGRMFLQPSPRRINQAVQQIADAGAALITSIRSCGNLKRIPSESIDQVMDAVRQLKTTTDQLSERVQKGDFDPAAFGEEPVFAVSDEQGKVRIKVPL
ncbi:Mesoderm development candidate 1 [Cichlidogyrus casuarinus]|uniref:Mesoderm development candidate 1 n=1 Tax=Cichlidogyrus casuarinus TaxID=1844966 RepID=A0ABD2PZD2_9PLAT